MTPLPQADSEAQLAAILKSLDDDKAEDVVQIDLRGKTAMGDYMVIARRGRSRRFPTTWQSGSRRSTACRSGPRARMSATGC
jgi:ribosomal silencing factor RsfS